jgi:ubiquinone/menaquinone biosynthesis C-methylase UbiE
MTNKQTPNEPLSHLTSHASKNRALWESISDTYQQQHAEALAGKNAMCWGVWRIPEFGCGAARWSIALAERGARPVGLDFSSRQLQYARRFMQEAGVNFPLIEASAENVPFPNASFDIIFCDWGTMTFCDPQLTVPEASRLLRLGGLFAFSTATPISIICHNMQTDQVDRTLHNDYFGMNHLEWPDEVDFQLPYGEWIRLFRRNGFIIEDLIETRPAEGATSTYRTEAENEWARHWPMENIWKLRKEQ